VCNEPLRESRESYIPVLCEIMFILELHERKLNSSDTFYCRHPVSHIVEICEVVSQMNCFDWQNTCVYLCYAYVCIFVAKKA
jgi:hypothetical protein